ncbi:MAG: hypothetical protein B7Z37_19250 [Verrucomicrobia bacterium 12-59-8]|nr:MAG: hypothetical protein B7Z37_19250 [Verrucomicrobia bacterium 12-59-8]
MKLPTHDTVTAFEQPSVWNWLIVFICGFLTVCIIGPVLCLGLWLVGKGALAMESSVFHAVLDVPLPSAVSIVLLIATVFGACLATMMVLELARRRREGVRVQGHHPIIGDFEYLPHFKTWHAKPVLPTGTVVRLNGFGNSPADTQAALWQQFIARYDALSAAMKDALLTLPHPLQECASVTLTPEGITLTKDGRLKIGFQFTTRPEAFWNSEIEEPFPIAVFSPTLELEKAEWVRPFV